MLFFAISIVLSTVAPSLSEWFRIDHGIPAYPFFCCEHALPEPQMAKRPGTRW